MVRILDGVVPGKVVPILDGVESKIETSVLGKTAVLGKIYTFIKILVGQKRGGKRLLCLTVVTLLVMCPLKYSALSKI